jgi:hypothetical protein
MVTESTPVPHRAPTPALPEHIAAQSASALWLALAPVRVMTE